MTQYKTFIRVRPDTSSTQEFKISKKSISLSGTVLGTYDEFLMPRDNNLKIFQSVKTIIDDFFHGYNGCIMAFGCVKAGKSHTLFGNTKERGIVELAFEYIFDQYIAKKKDDSICRITAFCVADNILKDLVRPSNENLKVIYDTTRILNYSSLNSHICLRRGHALEIKNASDNYRNSKENQGHVFYKVIIETRQTNKEGLVRSKYRELDIVELNFDQSTSLFDFMNQMTAGNPLNIEDSQSNLIINLGNLLSGNCKAALICHVQLSKTADTKTTLAFANTLKQLKCEPSKKYFMHQDERYYVELNDELDKLINMDRNQRNLVPITNEAPTTEWKNCVQFHQSIMEQLESFEKFSSNCKDMETFGVQLRNIIQNWEAARSLLPTEESRDVVLKGEVSSSFFNGIQREAFDLEIAVKRLEQIFIPAHLVWHRNSASNAPADRNGNIMNLTAEEASFMNGPGNKENQVSKMINNGKELSRTRFSTPPLREVLRERPFYVNVYQEMPIIPALDSCSFKCEDSSQDLDDKKWKSYQSKRVLVITQGTQTC